MAGMVFAAVYAALIFLVYFAQMTTVRLDALDGQAMRILDYSRGGLFFHYDLLGYGMMALSTFFVGLTGVFGSMSSGESSMGGVAALEFWCAYFIPIGILSLVHFRKG